MKIHKQFNKGISLSDNDFLEIIQTFDTKGKTIDDRGRNLIKSFNVKGITVNVKSFKPPHLINQIAYRYFRKSKARRSFEYANILKSKDIGTPQPFAYYEYFNSLGLEKSFYFSKQINYDLTYRELRADPKYPDFENILRQFTCFTFKLHEEGIFFKDHSAGNTLIVKNGKVYDFYLIDLNRMDFKKLSLDERMKNFAKLTEKDDMVRIMSDEYSKLIGIPFETIYKKMWDKIKIFRKKYKKKAALKEKYFN